MTVFMTPSTARRAAALLVAVHLACVPASAAAETALPPYEPELLRLAEILGAVHYLRELCGADEGQTWRGLMEKLIDAENPTSERRAGLVERFNRGYRGFEQTYHDCNETALWVIDTYMSEGAEIARRVASRYGE